MPQVQSTDVLSVLTSKGQSQVQKYLDQVREKELKVLIGSNLKDLINASSQKQRDEKLEELK